MTSLKDILPKSEKDIKGFNARRFEHKLKSAVYGGEAHLRDNYEIFSDTAKDLEHDFRSGKWMDTKADRRLRMMKEASRKSGNKFTYSDEQDAKLFLHAFGTKKLKEIREKAKAALETKEKNKNVFNRNLGIKLKRDGSGKDYLVLREQERKRDPFSEDFLNPLKRAAKMSIFHKSSGPEGERGNSAGKGWFTYAGMEKAGNFGVSGKIETGSGFAKVGAASGNASAKDQFGNKSTASISSPKPGADFRSAGSGIPLAPMNR
jgi:hypothetical protein